VLQKAELTEISFVSRNGFHWTLTSMRRAAHVTLTAVCDAVETKVRRRCASVTQVLTSSCQLTWLCHQHTTSLLASVSNSNTLTACRISGFHGKKVKLSLCLANQALRHEDVSGSGCIDPHSLDLGTSCRWVGGFTPLPLYPRGKSPRYPLDRRLSGPQSLSGQRGEEKVLDPTGTRTPTPWSSSP
jgi:hypothetical protein